MRVKFVEWLGRLDWLEGALEEEETFVVGYIGERYEEAARRDLTEEASRAIIEYTRRTAILPWTERYEDAVRALWAVFERDPELARRVARFRHPDNDKVVPMHPHEGCGGTFHYAAVVPSMQPHVLWVCEKCGSCYTSR